MAPSSKEAQRAELHKTIWRIANDLRGSVDGWDFKSYVLGMLFYRFISENLTAYLNERSARRGHRLRLRQFIDKPTPSSAVTRRSRRRGSTSSRRISSPTYGSGRVTTRTSMRPSRGSSATSRRSAIGTESEDDFKGLFDDLDVNSSKLGPPLRSGTRSSSNCSTRSATSTSVDLTATPSTLSAMPTSS